MPTTKKFEGFSESERKAMQARAKELAAEAKAGKNRAAGEQAIQDAISAMSEPDKSMAKKLHGLMSKNFPQLMPRTWYGFPSYAKDEKIVCFFQYSGKFKTRYSTLGFNDVSTLDDGNMWPVAYALTKISDAEEKKIIALVKKALG